MKMIGFNAREIAGLTASELTAMVKTSAPAYMAIVDGKPLYMYANGEADDGTTDETDLPTDRIALRKVVVFAQAEGTGTKVPVVVSYRTIGEVDESTAFRLIGQLSAKLCEGANGAGKNLLQTKIDVAQNADTNVVVFRKNGGGNYKIEDAASYFGFESITAIDAAMDSDFSKHQLAIAGQKDGQPIVTRFSPHTGQEVNAANRIELSKDATNVTSIAIDRRTLMLVVLVVSNLKTEGYANENGNSETTKINGLDGADAVRFKGDGLYAFNAEGKVVYFERIESDGSIDLAASEIVLRGADAGHYKLHDVNLTDDGQGGFERTAILTARDQSTTGARTWTTQSLQGTQAA